MKKFKIFWDFTQEEAWLDEMAQNGHILKNYSSLGFYSFTDGESQTLHYKIDYKIFQSKADYSSYLALFEDAGWQHICGRKSSGSQYFLPATAEAGTEIFSDAASANMRYKTLYEQCLASVAIWVALYIVVFLVNGFTFNNTLFLTPGLWEMTGAEFWSAFFFELPWAILRLVGLLFWPAVAIAYGYWAGKAKKAYDSRNPNPNQNKEEGA